MKRKAKLPEMVKEEVERKNEESSNRFFILRFSRETVRAGSETERSLASERFLLFFEHSANFDRTEDLIQLRHGIIFL